MKWSWGIIYYLVNRNLMVEVTSGVGEGLMGALCHVVGRMRGQADSGLECRLLTITITILIITEQLSQSLHCCKC